MTKVQDLLVYNLKRLRALRGYSQMLLAEKADISLGFIGDIEAGKKFPSAATLQKFVNALEIEPYQLFVDGRNGSPPLNQALVASIEKELIGRLGREVSLVFNEHNHDHKPK